MNKETYLEKIINSTKLTFIYDSEKEFIKEISPEGNTIIFLPKNSNYNSVKLHLPSIDEKQIDKNINCYIDLSKVNTSRVEISKTALYKNYPQIYITKFPENLQCIYYDRIRISKFNIEVIIEQLKYFIKENILNKVSFHNFLSSEILEVLLSLKECKWNVCKINKEDRQFFINIISLLEIIANEINKTNEYSINVLINSNYLKCYYNKNLKEMIKIKNDYLKLQKHSIEF